MADPVALASVISSGLIAGGSLWFNYRNGRQQRTHEASLAYEARVWGIKNDALFEVISATRRLCEVFKHASVDAAGGPPTPSMPKIVKWSKVGLAKQIARAY